MSLGPGTRNDLSRFRDDVKGGKRRRYMFDNHLSTMAKYRKLYDDINLLYKPKRHRQRTVDLLIGPTRSGKTRAVYDLWDDDSESFYEIPITSGAIWYDGYDGEKNILFDEFKGEMRLNNLLKIIDGYFVRKVPTKGSHCWWNPEVIAITTNHHPVTWYKWTGREESYRALCSRFSSVTIFSKEKEPTAVPDLHCNEFHPYWTEAFEEMEFSHNTCHPECATELYCKYRTK